MDILTALFFFIGCLLIMFLLSHVHPLLVALFIVAYLNRAQDF